MSWHEMACDAGYGPNDNGHAEMEAMAESQCRHEFEMKCAGEAAEQAQAEAAQEKEEAAKRGGVDAVVNPQHGQPAISQLYNELLMAVAQKFPGESRHETALRYIRSVERNSNCGVAKQQA